MPPASAVLAHRRNITDLARLAQNDLRLLLTPITDAAAARDALQIALPQLVDIYGSASATLAADWYDDLRDLDAGGARRFTVAVAELPDAGRTEILARWAVEPLFSATPDMPTAISKASGGLQRIIAGAARDTVTYSTLEDPAARGWIWSAAGGCDYCRRRDGNEYVTPDSLKTHDHCGCLAVPDFR